jgi:dUTP pyrophosphatase
MKVKIKKLRPDAKIPTYGSEEAACFDFYAVEREIIGPGSTRLLPTGLAFELPKDHVMLIFLRSSLSKCGYVSNVGVVDSDYRGEVFVAVTNASPGHKFVDPGERLGQAMVVPRPVVEFEEVEELSETARGTGGYGSTGK